MNGHNIPDAMTTRKVSVIGPKGEKMINNPLYSYELPEVLKTQKLPPSRPGAISLILL